MTAPLAIHPEVADAINDGQPIVALESTLIAHGFPREQRRDVAHRIERVVRDAGAIPATMLVHEGRAHIGLDDIALERLEGPEPIVKASIDQLPYVLAAGITAATTVSSSIALASSAGIDVFSTGGLGGVHRGAADTFDVSGDLAALANHSTLTVTAGAKSILDVPATVERLEALGVTVLTLGSNSFPAYYVADSGATTTSVDQPEAAAATLTARRSLNIGGSVLLACPPPIEHRIDPDAHDHALQSGLDEITRQGISGADITPVLLRHLSHATGGQSSEAGLAITIATATHAATAARSLT